jgi:hypothetical protein
MRRIVPMICATVAQCYEDHNSDQLAGLDAATHLSNFVWTCLERMPRAYSAAIRAFTLIFAFAGVIYGGRWFPANRREDRIAQWQQWRSHRLSPCRDFVRFYESLIVLNLYSRPGAVSYSRVHAAGALR